MEIGEIIELDLVRVTPERVGVGIFENDLVLVTSVAREDRRITVEIAARLDQCWAATKCIQNPREMKKLKEAVDDPYEVDGEEEEEGDNDGEEENA